MLGIHVAHVNGKGLIVESDDINTSRVNMDKDYNAYAANIAAMNIFNELYACDQGSDSYRRCSHRSRRENPPQ